MKDKILDDIEKKDIIRKFLLNRIKENKKLFTKNELNLIEENIQVFKKIYILGLMDSN